MPYLLNGFVIFPYVLFILATLSASKETISEKDKKIKQLTSQLNKYEDLIKNLTVDTRNYHKSLQKAADDVDKISERLKVSLGMCNIASLLGKTKLLKTRFLTKVAGNLSLLRTSKKKKRKKIQTNRIVNEEHLP